MDARAERLEALVLRTVAYGDSDRVVQLLVHGRGRVAAFARGARASQKRFGGALEPFQRVQVLLVERAGQDLWSLREASLLESFSALRDDLHRLAHASYAAELAFDLSRAGEPADALFALTIDFFRRLAGGAATSSRLRALEIGALRTGGLAPELGRCARCGEPLPAGRVAFDVAAGGAVCRRCAAPGSLGLTPGARALLEQLQRGGLQAADLPLSADGSGRPADLAAFGQAARDAQGPLRAFFEHHLGRAMRTADFLRQVGAPE